jgi:hypothetical protein
MQITTKTIEQACTTEKPVQNFLAEEAPRVLTALELCMVGGGQASVTLE